jgi:hypothetical protein
MAKIGSSLPPGVPLPRPAASPRPAAPVSPPSAPASSAPAAPEPHRPPAPQAAGTPAPVNARQVVQQFGSAFVSAGKLAGQLVRGLVDSATQPAAREAPARRKEAARSESSESSHEPGSLEGGELSDSPTSAKTLLAGTFGAAFAALKRASLRKARKRLRKQASAASVLATSRRHPDDELDSLETASVRTYLHGDDPEESQYDQARNKALFLEHLERQGEPPVSLMRHLNLQLGPERAEAFRRLFVEQVRPQVEALADKVGACTSEERQKIAALVSRTAIQVGPNSAEAFEKLLISTGVGEAEALASAGVSAAGRVAGLEQALRVGVSLTYRHAIIERSQPWLGTLGREWLGLGAEREAVIRALLRSAELLAPHSLRLMAQAFTSGFLQAEGAHKAGALAASVVQELAHAPRGAAWGVQLAAALALQGDRTGAQQLAEALTGALREARQRCVPGFSRLRHLQSLYDPEPEASAAWEELERASEPLAEMLIACMHVAVLRGVLRPLCPELNDEALVCLGSLDVVGATRAGQSLLRQDLHAQAHGEPSLLSLLPPEAVSLSQPGVLGQLAASGLFTGHYQFGGVGYLQRVACRTARALAGMVIARTQKGDALGARTLLRVGIRRNAVLWGLTSEGAKWTVELLEPLRAKPNPAQVQRTMVDLEKLWREHATEDGHGSAESLRVLVAALGQREPRVITRKEERLVTMDLTTADEVASQAVLSREREPT